MGERRGSLPGLVMWEEKGGSGVPKKGPLGWGGVARFGWGSQNWERLRVCEEEGRGRKGWGGALLERGVGMGGATRGSRMGEGGGVPQGSEWRRGNGSVGGVLINGFGEGAKGDGNPPPSDSPHYGSPIVVWGRGPNQGVRGVAYGAAPPHPTFR